jgi:hypothetical protein
MKKLTQEELEKFQKENPKAVWVVTALDNQYLPYFEAFFPMGELKEALEYYHFKKLEYKETQLFVARSRWEAATEINNAEYYGAVGLPWVSVESLMQ